MNRGLASMLVICRLGAREELQCARAGRASTRAKQVKLTDKICNLKEELGMAAEGLVAGAQATVF